jgi:hypothetical protein
MGRVAIAWSDTSNDEKTPHIFARVSLDSGSAFTNVLDLTTNSSAASRHPDVTIAGSKMFVVWEQLNGEARQNTIKVTSMDIKNISTGPAQDVDPTIHMRVGR